MSERKRSGAAWQKLALGYLDALYGFAVVLCRNPVEAEDLVQETYMQAVPHFAQLKAESNLKAWLFTILRNAWLKQLRHLRCGPEFVALDDSEARQKAIDTDDPEALYIRIWQSKEIRAAIEQLPSHCAETIVLCDIEGFSYKETAEILDCPIGTVMSRLARARAKLKRVLGTRLSPVTEKPSNGEIAKDA